jgi:hypothetical protein
LAPPPGTDINNRTAYRSGHGAHLLLEAVELAPQRATYRQQALPDRLRARRLGNEFGARP